MTRRFHPGTFTTGLIFAAFGAVFLAENRGWWTFEPNDLKLMGPLLVILIGVAVLMGSLRHRVQ
jgi:drug/metabolite transporter superfamily protein YnfA